MTIRQALPIKKITGSYLSHISDPLNGGADKLELLKYLQRTENSLAILEVGPGAGDALANAINISKQKKDPDEYFVVDIDSTILEHLKKHPDISQYDKIKYFYQDILEPVCFDKLFDVINLSAIMHECATYHGGRQAIEYLADSTAKLLNQNGVLLLRDLECNNFQTIARCELSGTTINIFFRLFFRKFLSQEFCCFCKPAYYEVEAICIYIQGTKYSVQDFFCYCQKAVVDDSIILEAPIGLIKEVQRHFLTFLNAYTPEYFYCIQESSEGYELLSFSKNNALQNFIACCHHINVHYSCSDNSCIRVGKNDLCLIESYIRNKIFSLTQPHYVKVAKKYVRYLRGVMNKLGCVFIEKNGQFELSVDSILLLDDLLTNLHCQSNVNPHILDWSRREGNEYYYFGNWDEVITLFVRKSLPNIQDVFNGENSYDCLVPISTSFVPRQQYINILKLFFKELGKERGYTELEGKRIVHLQKLPMRNNMSQIIDFFKKHYGKVDHELVEKLKFFRDTFNTANMGTSTNN